MIDRATVTMRELFGKVRKRERDYLTFWIWSYLTVGLLFGLTLPGVSAHGFLRGGGWGKGLYSSKPYKASSEKDRQRGTEKAGRTRRDRSEQTEREKRSGGGGQIRGDTKRLSSKKDGERKRGQTGRDRSRQIK